MKDIKQILADEPRVWFHIKEEDRKAFLSFAKENGCKWMNGDEIDVKNDNCGQIMGINEHLQLGFVLAQFWFSDKGSVKKVEFDSIKE